MFEQDYIDHNKNSIKFIIYKEFKVASQLATITNSISCYIYCCTVFHQHAHQNVLTATVLHPVQRVRQVTMYKMEHAQVRKSDVSSNNSKMIITYTKSAKLRGEG